MLLINQLLLKMSKGLRRYIVLIAILKLIVLESTATFARNISIFMYGMVKPDISFEVLKSSIAQALIVSFIMLLGELAIGEVEYRCTAKSRIVLRKDIFTKILELDVGNIEKIGASKSASDVVDGIESMQVYYSKYLPGLLYSFIGPIYLFFRLKDISMNVALLLLVVSIIILPINNYYRKTIDALKSDYWAKLRDLTSYYLESLRFLTTIKLFNQDYNRYAILKDKAYKFKEIIMKTMKINFSSFLLTDTMIYSSVVISTLMICNELKFVMN